MLTDISRRAADAFADTPAFVADPPSGRRWSISYAELDRAADDAAAGLAARGISQGSVLALAMPSVIDYVVLYLAAARIGAVTAGLNPRFRPAETRSALAVLRPDLVFTTTDLEEGTRAVEAPVEVLEVGRDVDTVAAAVRISGASQQASQGV